MSNVQLGMLAPNDADRDATHVAVVPMVAATEMEPGTHCEVTPDGTAGLGDNPIGIVDPFLKANVSKGQRFFLCLYPRTVTGLRHHYLHPVLDGASAATSKDWIEKWASSQGILYDELMSRAQNWVMSAYDYDGYWIDGGRFEGQRVPSEFWDHYDRVTDTKTPANKRHSFFSCAC